MLKRLIEERADGYIISQQTAPRCVFEVEDGWRVNIAEADGCDARFIEFCDEGGKGHYWFGGSLWLETATHVDIDANENVVIITNIFTHEHLMNGSNPDPIPL